MKQTQSVLKFMRIGNVGSVVFLFDFVHVKVIIFWKSNSKSNWTSFQTVVFCMMHTGSISLRLVNGEKEECSCEIWSKAVFSSEFHLSWSYAFYKWERKLQIQKLIVIIQVFPLICSELTFPMKSSIIYFYFRKITG